MNIEEKLRDLGACGEARAWVESLALPDAWYAPRAAWIACERANWLLWIAARAGVDQKLLVLTACACARTSLLFVLEGALRPL
jgi:hypothetical protein